MAIAGQDQKVVLRPTFSRHDRHAPGAGRPMRGNAQDFSGRPSGRDKGIRAKTGKPPKNPTGTPRKKPSK